MAVARLSSLPTNAKRAVWLHGAPTDPGADPKERPPYDAGRGIIRERAAVPQ